MVKVKSVQQVKLAFMKFSIQQLKWVLLEKPEMRHKYVMNIIEGEWELLYEEIDQMWDSLSEDYIFVYSIENCNKM